MDFSFAAKDQVRLLDGGIGTWLASQDEAHAVAPHQACIKNPSLVSSLHQAYARAGAQALQANAWLALHLKEAEAERTVRAAADCLDFALENSEGQPAPARLLSMAPGLGTPPSGKVALLDHDSSCRHAGSGQPAGKLGSSRFCQAVPAVRCQSGWHQLRLRRYPSSCCPSGGCHASGSSRNDPYGPTGPMGQTSVVGRGQRLCCCGCKLGGRLLRLRARRY
jgi:hypothetical protein